MSFGASIRFPFRWHNNCTSISVAQYFNFHEYEQDMPQSQLTEQPTAPRGKDTGNRYPHNNKKTIKIKQPGFRPRQDYCKTTVVPTKSDSNIIPTCITRIDRSLVYLLNKAIQVFTSPIGKIIAKLLSCQPRVTAT